MPSPASPPVGPVPSYIAKVLCAVVRPSGWKRRPGDEPDWAITTLDQLLYQTGKASIEASDHVGLIDDNPTKGNLQPLLPLVPAAVYELRLQALSPVMSPRRWRISCAGVLSAFHPDRPASWPKRVTLRPGMRPTFLGHKSLPVPRSSITIP